jgi:type I restriction enzyme S subunit
MKIIYGAPKSWKYLSISAFIHDLESGVSVNSSEDEGDPGTKILKTSCVSLGRFDPTEAKPVVHAEITRLRCPTRKGRRR